MIQPKKELLEGIVGTYLMDNEQRRIIYLKDNNNEKLLPTPVIIHCGLAVKIKIKNYI
jgi:hypothetical protein